MAKKPYEKLSVRERQIMDVVYRLGEATAAEIHAEMPDPPSYSAVRATLAILEKKQQLKHHVRGKTYVYRALKAAGSVSRSVLRRLVDTFFEGRSEHAISALLDEASSELSQEELDRLQQKIARARKEGR